MKEYLVFFVTLCVFLPRQTLPVASSSKPGLLHSHLKLPTTLTHVPPTQGDETHSSISGTQQITVNSRCLKVKVHFKLLISKSKFCGPRKLTEIPVGPENLL